ncbi:hypothetical protein HDU96_006893 [Phlyctochytrium bullatum]|nr:hypothetical protein HDU96_006893 [Phlyctochytrium bullatum]
MDLKQAVFQILKSHNILDEFLNLGSRREDIWSIEICPKEGICDFSRPLVVAKELDVVRVGLMFHDVWEISFDPVLEFRVSSDAADATWQPIALFRPHLGQVDVDESKLAETLEVAKELAQTLSERGYADLKQAMARRLQDNTSKPELY